jgi:hypothetical protein
LKFFFIIPTLNERPNELKRLIESINISNDLIEKQIIIINQSEEKIIKEKEHKNIFEIQLDKKGTSNAKNIGIQYILDKAEDEDIICFPDDDCWYPQDSLKIIINNFKNNKYDAIVGKAYDPIQNKDFGFEQYKKSLIANKNNAHKFLMISMFFKVKIFKDSNIRFDSELGVGAKYGCGEETDLLLNILNKDNKVFFDNRLIIYHLNYKMKIEQLISYSYGQGALLKKIIFKYRAFKIFFGIILRPLLGMFCFAFLLKFEKSNRYFLRLKNLTKGFYDYEL